MQPDIKLDMLDNGLRVVTLAMPALRTAACGVWVDVGARYEPAEVNGVAHLLEHMAFKGTRRRTAKGIAEEIEDVGGHLNAYTTREQTAYYARVLGDDLPLALDLVADILRNSVIDAGELAREREVVLQEIGQVHDTPDDLVFDLFQEAAYPGQPLGRSILGPADIVADLPRDALLAYMEEHYKPERMVLAAAGHLEHAQVVDMAERLFGDMQGGRANGCSPAAYAGGEHRAERDLEQVHICLGLPAFGYIDPDFYALQVFSSLLGGGMSSRLFQEVRENRGLAYSVFSYTSCYRDHGLLGIYAGTGDEHSRELLDVVADECRRFVETVDESEAKRGRAQLKTSQAMALESASAMCEDMARQLIAFGRVIPQDEILAKIDAVDVDLLKRVGRRLLAAGTPTLAALGPLADMPRLDEFSARLG
jgi:predicted Zn-dependent peptidase